ncbi:vacuolar segregation subunit 7-domain-containing protein [Xylaria sp. CBS 124048]|nr:vacuolar segregation subunit 7-domain-containing protein [Xylaria sp. CBS 124048]
MMGSRSDTAGLEASFSSPNNSVDNDTSVPSSANLDTQPSMWTSASTSVTASPTDSRDNSPTRPTKPPARVNRATTSPTLSRKNSTQDPSPPRKRSSIPTSITPRQLSASGIPSLPPPTSADYLPRPPVPPKPSSAVLEAAKESPRWPISPRLKSPPPSAPSFTRPTVASTARRNDLEAPAINVQRATPAPSPHVEPTPMPAPEPEVEEYHLPSGMRTPARGPSSGSSTLETVQEVSQPNTPRAGLDASIEKLDENAGSDSGARNGNYDTTASSVKSSQTATNSESGSDSGSANNNAKRSSSKALPLLRSRQSSSAIKFNGRGQTSGESSSRNMTVETEEVKDMPQLSLIPNTGGQRVNGSLRTRASNETIKPRKDKKKNTRKTTSVASGNGEPPDLIPTQKLRHSCSARSFPTKNGRSRPRTRGQGSWGEEGMPNPGQRVKRPAALRTPSITSHMAQLLTLGTRPASSKADIFEAKVASAVEEANSSDSDEKFVYDSNPPDAERPRRYHSRTPSVASMASQVDRNGMRSIHTVLENGTHNVHVKKNMKFVNTYTNNGNEPLHGDDDARGAGRSNVGSARGPARYHHHPHGRWGRNNNSHASLFDNESPFPNAARSGFSGHKSRPPSNPPSPQSTNFNRGWLSGDKRQMTLTNGYNMDDTAPVVEDERTPLLRDGTGRTAWSNRNRRHVPPRNLESQTYRRNPSLLNRFASCLVLIVMLLLVVTGAIGFMFATSQPLTDVALLKIGNVLASEQELMFDLTVQAHNPNVVVVMIDSADIEVFAKSPHAGNDSQWWRHPQGDDFKILDDPKNDPPNLEEPADGDASPNMRLGNIHTFDSPLTYEGSFFHREYTTSSGELRLARPGNSTDSGTARWERIISDDFTLVIKGVLKYTLPLSHKVRKVSISGKTLVKPNAANDPSLRPTEPETTISIKKATAWTA